MKKIINGKGLITILLFATILATSGLAMAETPTYGGVMKIILNRAPLLFGDPSLIRGGDFTSAFPCIEPLFRIDKDGNIQPRLVTSWKLADDQKSLTLFLRKGVKFHDGTDFNSEAVKWNLEERRKGKRGGVERITTIDVIDDHTVKLNLSKFDNSIFSKLAYSAGQMASPTAIKKNGKDWAKTHPVGTGPFEFVSYRRGTSLKYKKFEGYWDKGKPYLDGLEFLYIKDAMTARASFEAGEAHIFSTVRPARIAHDLGKKGYKIHSTVSGMHVLLGDSVNSESIFADKRVRMAVEHAINKQAIVKALGYGLWEAANQMSPTTKFAYNPSVKGYAYDPEKAKKLLAEAGHPNGLKTKAIVPTQFANRDSMVAVKRDLQKVGIDLQLEFVDRGKWYEHKYKGWKDCLMFLFGGVDPNYDESLQRVLASTANAYPSVVRPDGWDEAIESSLVSEDFNFKKTAMQKAVKIATDNAMAIPLWFSASASVIGEGVHTDYCTYHHVAWTPAEAWLEK